MRLALDDFGTGYSSLGYLQRLPSTSLKIDRAFVDRLGDRAPTTRPSSGRSSGSAHALGLRVVAEGVETDASGPRSSGSAATARQGYLFSRPLPAAELDALLLSSRA